MSTQEQARELMVQQRQNDENQQESVLRRSEAEVDNPSDGEAVTDEQARELMAQQRHHEEQLQQSMLIRTEAEVGIERLAADFSQDQ
jgi:hypothetical protein